MLAEASQQKRYSICCYLATQSVSPTAGMELETKQELQCEGCDEASCPGLLNYAAV